jgi:hypothetical protein
MYPINNSSIYDDNSASLPLGVGKKRKFTMWFDSTGGEKYTNIELGELENPSDNQTFAIKYQLPYALKSSTGFFDVCVKSVVLGNNPINSLISIDDSVDPNQVIYSTFTLNNSSYKVNMVASSPYNGYVGDNEKDKFVEEHGEDAESVYVIANNAYTYDSVQPIGSFQVLNNGNSSQMNVIPNRLYLNVPPAPDPPEGISVSTGNTLNIPSYPTKCDDISVTVPDAAFVGKSISIVLSTIGSTIFDINDTGATLSRYSVPLLFNPNQPLAIPADLPFAVSFPVQKDSYKLFNLPYSICLQFLESDG